MSAEEELAKLKKRRDQANKRITQLRKISTPTTRKLIEKEEAHILAYNRALEAQKKMTGEKTVAEAKQSEFSAKVKKPKKQPSSLKNNNKTNAMKERTGKAPTKSNNKDSQEKFVSKIKKSVKDAKEQSAKKGIEDFNKSVKGAESAVAKRKDVEKLDDDALKAKRRADARKESKSQPDGPSSAPKDKKEGKSVKESLKDQFFRQDVRKYGPFTVDSTDRGMSKYGDSDNWKELEAEEEMNLRKGGTARRKAFGKGGMYKGPKKTYGMRKGGFTNRGQMS